MCAIAKALPEASFESASGTCTSYSIRENKVNNYQCILVLVAKKYFIVSLTVNENTAESDIIKSVSVSGTAGKFGIPNVTIAIPAIKLSTIAYSRVLLGLDVQKCLRSLTLKIKKIAEKKRISKVNV